MRANEFITERVSSIVYHAISFDGALKVLSTNKLRGVGNAVSLTRTLLGTYHMKNTMIGVIFELDGDKLNHKYKGHGHGADIDHDNWYVDADELEKGSDFGSGTPGLDPDAYYAYDDENDKLVKIPKDILKNTDEDGDIKMPPRFSNTRNGQAEDVIRTPTGAIDDIVSYIKSAIIYTPKEYLDDYRKNSESHWGSNYLDDITNNSMKAIKLLDKYNIPYRFVTSEKQLANKKINDKKGFYDILRGYTDNDNDVGNSAKRMVGLNMYRLTFAIFDDSENDNKIITQVVKAYSEEEAIKIGNKREKQLIKAKAGEDVIIHFDDTDIKLVTPS